MKKIYFIVPYPTAQAPSQRFRFEQYYAILDKAHYTYHISPFLDMQAWSILYKPGHFALKIWKILLGFFRRCLDLFTMADYDYVFIHREATPIGPPIFEWFIAKVLRKKIIYDFDDAIWLENSSTYNRIVAGIKWHSKVGAICKWSHKVSCGNDFLADYARQFNTNVVVNPTTIDTEHLHNQVKDQHTPTLTIGWTGTHSTSQYLHDIVHILQKLEQTFDFTFLVISNAEPTFNLRSLRYIHWNKDTEIEDLLQFNIGIMPLRDDDWSRGKCGFKALQYMSLGIPALVSPVGVNTKIVDSNVNGMICNNPTEWEASISAFLTDAHLRVQLGIAARAQIVKHYSVLSNTSNFLGLFKN